MSSGSEDEPFESSGSEFLPSNSSECENNFNDNDPTNNKRERKKTRKSTSTGKLVQERKQGDDCKCSHKCIDKLSDAEKQEIITDFNNLSSQEKQDSYLSRTQKYICDFCNKEFQHFGRYTMHRRRHKISYSCQEDNCFIIATDKEEIVKHQKETGHEGISSFEKINDLDGKLLLSENFVVPSSLNNPENDENNIPDNSVSRFTTHACKICDKTFSCKQNYEVHMDAVHYKKKPFICNICQKDFPYSYSLKAHMSVHNSEQRINYPCDQCDKVCQHQNSLLYHKESEHSNLRFVCNKCNKSFKHRQLLLKHQLVHTDKKPFKCVECKRQFKSKANLINHENIHSKLKRYVCPICKNEFLHKTSLFVHLRWHRGAKPYECDVCQKSFSQKGNLVEHRRIHTGEKPYMCNICNKTFTTSSQVNMHVKTHDGEKKFSCPICKKQFLYQNVFKTHLRRHMNERPFKCKFCEKSFPEQWACTKHERTHLGIKNYKCDQCDKMFIDRTNLNKHKKIHLKNEARIEKPKDVDEEESDFVTVNIPVLTTQPPEGMENNEEDLPATVQINDIMDHEGNPITFTTTDGQPIPIVSTTNDNFQGIMPDGSIVSFNILQASEEVKNDELEEQEV